MCGSTLVAPKKQVREFEGSVGESRCWMCMESLVNKKSLTHFACSVSTKGFKARLVSSECGACSGTRFAKESIWSGPGGKVSSAPIVMTDGSSSRLTPYHGLSWARLLMHLVLHVE